MTLLRNRRIFLIEDNSHNLAIMATILQQAGAATNFDRWGTSCLERMHNFVPIDIVLLDLMFPNEVTGYQVFEQIRADPDFAKLPVVAVSAADPAAEIPKLRRVGFVGFISKPIKFTLFAKQVAAILEGEEVWG